MKRIRSLSQELHQAALFCQNKKISLKELAIQLGPRGSELLIFLLTIPFLVFIPIPGISTLFGIFILFNGTRLAMKRGLWIPKFLAKRKLSGNKLAKSFRFGGKWVKRLEKWVRPRGEFCYRHPWMQRINGIAFALCGLFLALPLPPGTNFPPALAAALMALGLLEEDGLFVLFGYIIFFINLALFTLLFFFGFKAL